MQTPTSKQKQRLRVLINALTNGAYIQGEGLLFNEYTTQWCWAGVATDIYFNTTNNGHWVHPENSKYGIATTNSGKEERVNLLPEIQVWYGINKYHTNMLTDMNDTENSFTQIATYIKNNILNASNKTPNNSTTRTTRNPKH